MMLNRITCDTNNISQSVTLIIFRLIADQIIMRCSDARAHGSDEGTVTRYMGSRQLVIRLNLQTCLRVFD
jgi:hypothetical protein